MYGDFIKMYAPNGYKDVSIRVSEEDVNASKIKDKDLITTLYCTAHRLWEFNCNNIGKIRMTGYPNNCGLAIISGAYAYESVPNYKKLLKLVIKNCKEMGYSQLHYTVSDDPSENEEELEWALEELNFNQLEGSAVTNKRTEATIHTWILNI